MSEASSSAPRFTVELIHTSKKSIIWKYFGYLYTDGILTDSEHYFCKICVDLHQIITTKYEIKTATTPMLRHLDLNHHISCPNPAAIQKRTSSIVDPDTIPRSKSEKKTLFARSTALMIATDLLPFSLVSGAGFQKWMIDNKFVSSLEEIPSNTTISNSALDDVYHLVRDTFQKKISNAPKNIVIIIDMWTAKCGNIPYITICLKYINSDFDLERFTLTTEHLPRPHTSPAIAKCIEENLKENNIGDRSVIGVGDMGANVRAVRNVMKGMKAYVDCEAHKAHKNLTSDVVNDTRWKKATEVLGQLKRIHGALCYQLVKLKEIYQHQQSQDFLNYLSSLEELQKELETDESIPYFPNDSEPNETYQQAYAEISQSFSRPTIFEKPNVTRWFSMMKMVDSFIKNMDAINVLLTKTSNTDLIVNESQFEILNKLLKLYNVFHETLLMLQTSEEPTSMMVLAIRFTIVHDLKKCIEEEPLEEHKGIFQAVLDAYSKRIDHRPEYLGAALLDPSQLYSKQVEEELQIQNTTCEEVLKEMISKYEITSSSNSRPQSDSHKDNSAPSNAKQARLSFLQRINTQPTHLPSNEILNIDAEILSYKQHVLHSQQADVISFWKTFKNKFPTLFELARVLLAISPSSADAERNFSIAGAQLVEKRANQHPHRAHKALFIHSNAHLLKNNTKK